MVIKSRKLRLAGDTSRTEEDRRTFKTLTGIPAGKIPLGRPRRKWENHITMNLNEMGTSMENCVDSAQDKNYWRYLVNAALNLRVP